MESRRGESTIGFGGEVKKKAEKDAEGILKNVTPHDIVKFGLIPELVGRLPVIVSLSALDEAALSRILREPKNAVIKQYVKLLGMDGVELTFTDGAVSKIAKKAIERGTGARGLRSIMETIMLPIMFDTPSQTDKKAIVIDEETVEKAFAEK